jgi:hypothetical protein
MYRSDDFRTSTLLHSFVIFRVTETIFGMSGCFPVSQGLVRISALKWFKSKKDKGFCMIMCLYLSYLTHCSG